MLSDLVYFVALVGNDALEEILALIVLFAVVLAIRDSLARRS
jgi:hypothetical protein